MNDLYIGDAACVVPGSGITLTDAETGANHTQAVVPGATYAVTVSPVVSGGHFHFSITGTVLTAANIEWVCCAGETIIIRIPDNVNVLNYQSLANGGTAWVRRLAMP